MEIMSSKNKIKEIKDTEKDKQNGYMVPKRTKTRKG